MSMTNVHAPYAASLYGLCVDSPGRALLSLQPVYAALSDGLFTLN